MDTFAHGFGLQHLRALLDARQQLSLVDRLWPVVGYGGGTSGGGCFLSLLPDGCVLLLFGWVCLRFHFFSHLLLAIACWRALIFPGDGCVLS